MSPDIFFPHHRLNWITIQPNIDGMALPCNYREAVAAVLSDALLPWCLAFIALQLFIIYCSLDPSPPIQDRKRNRKPRSISTAGSVGDNKFVDVAKSPSTLHGKRASAQNKSSLVPSVTALRSRTRTTSTPNKNAPAPFVRVTSDSEVTTSNSDATSDSEVSSSKPARMRVAVRDPITLDPVFEKIAQWAHLFRLWVGQCRRYSTAAALIAFAVSLMRAWHIRLHHQVLDFGIDDDIAKAVRPTPSLVLYSIDEVLRTHAGIPSADLFEVNTTVLNGVPVAPMSLDRVLMEMDRLFRDTCGLVARSSLDKRVNGDDGDQTLRRARLGLEAECAMVMEGSVASEARIHVLAIGTLLEPLTEDGSSLWLHEGLSLSNKILHGVEALGQTCRDWDGFGQGPADHQRCSRSLLDTLQSVLDSSTWVDSLNTDLERHSRQTLEGIQAIRERIPRIDMLVDTLAQGAEEVVAARTLLQRAPQEGSSGLGFWTKKKLPKANDARASDYRELLRGIHAPGALQHLDSVALEPFERAFHRTYLQVRDQAIPGWKHLRNQLKAMSAHPIPKVKFVRHASSGTGPPQVVVVGPLPPQDGVWVDGSVVRYLPTIPQAVKMLTSANREITTLSNRITYEIGLVCTLLLPSIVPYVY